MQCRILIYTYITQGQKATKGVQKAKLRGLSPSPNLQKKLVLAKKQTGARIAPDGCRKQFAGPKPRAQSSQKQLQQKKREGGVCGAITGARRNRICICFFTQIFHFDQFFLFFPIFLSLSSLLSHVLMSSRTHEDSGGAGGCAAAGAAAPPPEKKKLFLKKISFSKILFYLDFGFQVSF
jgi:hypothetical protein